MAGSVLANVASQVSVPSSPSSHLPKLLLLNVCSLKKINSTNQKGCYLLAHDLSSLKIDIALITETHLRSSIPDSYVTIPGYRIFRRDRTVCNCRRTECSRPHKGGGVAIYYHNSYSGEIFDSADDCESFWIKLSQPNDPLHFLFINVTYHPPNVNNSSLIKFLTTSLNNIVANFPSDSIIIGGDFNRSNLQEVETRFCLSTLDSPPTRGDFHLDLILTNKPHLIDSTNTFEPSLKSDHLAIIMTPNSRIRPQRKKVNFTDYSFKGFQKLNESINNCDFSVLFSITDTDVAADWLDTCISDLVTNAFPIRYVTMSDRDPLWLTPKSKWLLLKKKKATKKNDSQSAKNIDSKLLSQKLSFLKKNESKIFWNDVDNITNRKVNNKSISNAAFNGEQLNNELANRSAKTEHKTTKVSIIDPVHSADVPNQLQLIEIANAMRKCKRSSPGPVNIPFFIFRLFWDILAPLYLHVWNLSLRGGKFPACYKRANLTPIPKTANASKADDIRGISVTPLSARIFEKVVHKKWILPNIVRLGDPLQFAYRPKISTADCLLTLQHYILSLLDQQNIDGVHIITIDFAKAFDRLDQSIASQKFPKFVDNSSLAKWLYDFSINRSQRLIWEGKALPFVNIDLGCSQGTAGGPNIFSIFTDDCNAKHNNNKIIKYSDDSTLIVPCFQNPDITRINSLNEEFNNICSWSNTNKLTINYKKSHHLRFCLNHRPFCSCATPALDSRTNIHILGVTFQTNCLFSNHVNNLIKFLRRSLYIIRDLKLKLLPQEKIDLVFDALILSRIRYCISVYGSDYTSINKIDKFLDSCYRHGHTSIKHSAPTILKQEDLRIAHNILKNPRHPLYPVLTHNDKERTTRHNLTHIKSRTNTLTFSRTFCNRVLPL